MKQEKCFTRFLRRLYVLIAVVSSSAMYTNIAYAGPQDLKGTKVDIGVRQEKIIEIMNIISNNTQYTFIYAEDIKNELNKTVKIEHDNNLHELLSDISNQSKLEFRAVNNNIVVRERSVKENNSMNLLQRVVVTGKVTSMEDDGELPGVNIVEKGTINGTVTDLDGKYSLEVPGSESIIVFSSVGFLSEEITVGTQTVINIALSPDITALDEIVVTALGIERNEASLGYSVSSVGNDEINQGGTANFLKNLDGKTTGVNLTNLSSDPTSSTFVVIRGATSIAGVQNKNSSGSAQPLYVIDGVPVGSGNVGTTTNMDVGNFMSEMSPDDIESITVLKGASAAALYGSEGGNGVIVITTKSGKSGQKGVGVSVTSSLTFDKAYKALEVQNLYAAGDRADEYETNSGSGNGPFIGGELATGTYRQWNMKKQIFEDVPITRRSDDDPLLAFLQTGLTSTNNVAVSGNYDAGSYRMSFTNLVNKGVVPNTKTTRNSLTFGAEYNILKNLKVSTNASYTNTYAPNKQYIAGREDRAGIIEAVYATTAEKEAYANWTTPWIDGYEGTKQNTVWIRDRSYVDDDDYNRMNYQVRGVNPYYAVEEMIKTYSRETIFGKAQLDWEIIEPLKFTVRTGLNKTTFHMQKRNAWDNRSYNTGSFNVYDNEDTRINTDVFLTYNKTFNVFDVSVLGGYNFRFTDHISTQQGGRNLARPNDYSIAAIATGDRVNQYSWGPGKYSSFYGTLSLGYNGLLFLDATIRKDYVGITELQKNDALYPGVSLSWLASETFAMPDWMNFLKIRGGVAQVGYGIPTFLNVNTYGFAANWNGATIGTVGGPVVNPDIKSEINTTTEFGIETAFLDRRILFDLTGFNKEHSNQIQNIPIPGSSGFNDYRTNIGTVVSKGLEASLTLVPVRTNDWEWSLTGNFTRMESEITKLDEAFTEKYIGMSDNVMLRLKEGELVGGMYAEEGFWRVNGGKHAGQIMLKQSSGTPIENDEASNRDFLGNYNPDFILGAITSLTYKAFSLNVVASYRSGGVYVSETAKILRDDGKSPWSLTGDEVFWSGGRTDHGGYAWPDPANIDIPSIAQKMTDDGRPFDDAGFWYGVFVDPRAGDATYNQGVLIDVEDRDQGDNTWTMTDPGTGATTEMPVYIENGADPNETIYAHNDDIVGNTWDFPQTRMFDATNFKLREVTLTYSIPSEFTERIGIHSSQVSFIARNVILWTKSGRNEDPETAFTGAGQNQGVARFTLPPIRQMGFKLNFNF